MDPTSIVMSSNIHEDTTMDNIAIYSSQLTNNTRFCRNEVGGIISSVTQNRKTENGHCRAYRSSLIISHYDGQRKKLEC